MPAGLSNMPLDCCVLSSGGHMISCNNQGLILKGGPLDWQTVAFSRAVRGEKRFFQLVLFVFPLWAPPTPWCQNTWQGCHVGTACLSSYSNAVAGGNLAGPEEVNHFKHLYSESHGDCAACLFPAGIQVAWGFGGRSSSKMMLLHQWEWWEGSP